MAVISLVRKTASRNRGHYSASDLRVIATAELKKTKPRRIALGLRLSMPCMKRLRWQIGDRVTADFDDQAMTWTIRKEIDGQGNCLSGQGKLGAGTVRFTVEESQLTAFGLSVGVGYDAELKSQNHSVAVFAII